MTTNTSTTTIIDNSINKSTLDFDFDMLKPTYDVNPFAQALQDFENANGVQAKIKIGTKVTGTLVSKNDRTAVIDFRGKTPVVINVTPQEQSLLATLEVGAHATVLITNIIDGKSFDISGSLYELKMIEMTDYLSDACAKRIMLTGTPTDFNHAGYNVLINIDDQQLSLFMPHMLTDVNRLPDQSSIVNTEIEFYLEPVMYAGHTSYIISRKAYLYHLAHKEKRNLKKGQVYTGHITGCTDFAVFVQFNKCLTGMIHKSNLGPEAVEMLPNIPAGTEIDFYVKDIMKDKLFLTQILRETLWDSIATNDVLVGKVSSIKDFGVMVDLDYETRGLLHKSVLLKPVDTYRIGESVNVVVTNVNKNNRQITLALK